MLLLFYLKLGQPFLLVVFEGQGFQALSEFGAPWPTVPSVSKVAPRLLTEREKHGKASHHRTTNKNPHLGHLRPPCRWIIATPPGKSIRASYCRTEIHPDVVGVLEFWSSNTPTGPLGWLTTGGWLTTSGTKHKLVFAHCVQLLLFNQVNIAFQTLHFNIALNFKQLHHPK